MNWDVYLHGDGFVRFAVWQNTERQIKGALESWLDCLKKNKIITFDPKGNPEVTVVGSMVSQENPGLILSLNPFAPKERILDQAIQVLKKYPAYSFARRDLLHPERMKALKLRGAGKNLKEIAFALWPKQFEQEEKRIAKKTNVCGKERASYDQYVNTLVDQGNSLGQAYRMAEKQFHLTGKTPVNSLIVKAYRLLK